MEIKHRLSDWGQDGRLKVLFVDQITVCSLLRLCRLGRSAQTIWYFEPIARSAQRLHRLLCGLGLIRAEVHHINHHIGQVQDGREGSELVKLSGYAHAICSKIKREHLAKNPLIVVMGSQWATEKLLLYFEKLTEKEVRRECLRVGLVQWMVRTQLRIVPDQCALLIEHKQWFSYLEAHARSQGIRLVAYGGLGPLGAIVAAGSWLLLASRKALPVLSSAIQSRLCRLVTFVGLLDLPSKAAAKKEPPVSTVAIRYWHSKLTFDSTERSEFFWLNGSGIPYSEILLYDFVADKPLDAETLNEVSARGVRLVGRGPGVTGWLPTWRIFTVLLRTTVKLMVALLTCLVRGEWISLYYVRKFLALGMTYAYWYDFFAANRVRVNVGTLNTSVGQVLALDALNGVSAGYQHSVSSILFPSTLRGAGETVQFVFSQVFERLRSSSIEASTDTFVHTGFIYDSAFQAIRGLKRVAEARKQLQENGARFVLCFFDENSVNRWDINASHQEAAADYGYLLEWLLADPSLGIVFKPKKWTSLFQRVACVSGLVDEARRTGRCTFLTSDTRVGSVFPVEAALMSDVCIGKLIGGTAALEARLAGVPTVLIDVEGFRNHPFRAWGHGGVVFDDWKSLRVAVEQYRVAPEAHPEFGDWSPGLNDLDPFRDGQASLRIGLYIRWIYDALKQGASKQQALALAADRFAQRWGAGHTTAGSSACTQ